MSSLNEMEAVVRQIEAQNGGQDLTVNPADTRLHSERSMTRYTVPTPQTRFEAVRTVAPTYPEEADEPSPPAYLRNFSTTPTVSFTPTVPFPESVSPPTTKRSTPAPKKQQQVKRKADHIIKPKSKPANRKAAVNTTTAPSSRPVRGAAPAMETYQEYRWK